MQKDCVSSFKINALTRRRRRKLAKNLSKSHLNEKKGKESFDKYINL